jgi:sugar phosphate permease
VTPTRVRFAVLAFLAAAAAVAYLGRNGMAVAEEKIRGDVGLTEGEMGFLLGPAFFWPYALLQLPLGWVGQRLGTRAWLPVLMLVSAAATAAFGLGGGFLALVVCRVVAGAAQAGLFPGCTQVIARWHPSSERATASGVLGAFMQVGAAAALFATGWLLAPVGWPALSVWYAVPGLVWAAGYWLWVRDDPADHPRVNRAERDLIAAGRPAAPPDPTGGVGVALLASPALWLICGQQFFRAAAYIFFGTWFPTYLKKTGGVSDELAGTLTLLPIGATFAGMLAGGRVSDWVLRRTGSLTHARRTMSILAVTAAGLTVASALLVSDVVAEVVLIGVGAFIAGLAAPVAYAITIDLGGRQVATVFAAMNMIGNVGAGLLPWVVPAVKQGVDADPTLRSVFGGSGWNAVLALFASLYFAAGACWLLLRVRGTVLDQSLIRRGAGDSDVR